MILVPKTLTRISTIIIVIFDLLEHIHAHKRFNMDPKNMIGKKCGDFTIKRLTGKGTFGHVFLVTRTDQESACSGTFQATFFALKMINTKDSSNKERVMTEREAKILRDMKKYEHRNIVKYVDFFKEDNYDCIVMEYCENGTLFDYIRKNKVVPENKFIDILRQIASGLEFLHSKDVLHRDVKSKNILLTGHNDIKIADFGVAREIPIAATGQMSLMVGSPQYMSPEMLANKPYDEKTDIWSLGCTCYEMGIGDYAFKAENIKKIREMVEKKELPLMEKADYCKEIKQLVMKMLQTQSVNRPTARQVLDTVKGHKCTNTDTLTATEIATVSPRTQEPPRPTVEEHPDSGVSSGTRTPSLSIDVRGEDFTFSSGATLDTVQQNDYFQTQSCKYQSQLVRLIGDNRASDKVSKIMKVLRKHPHNYDKIKEAVKKHLKNMKEDRFEKAFKVVLALKGVEEAISWQTTQSRNSESSTT